MTALPFRPRAATPVTQVPVAGPAAPLAPALPLLLTSRSARVLPVYDVNRLEVRHIAALPRLAELDRSRPTVIWLDDALLGASTPVSLAALAASVAIVAVGPPGHRAPAEGIPLDVLAGFIAADAPARAIAATLQGAFRGAAALIAARRAEAGEAERHREVADLAQVGVALTTQRDLLQLLDTVLTHARRLSRSDAGSIYLVERGDEDAPHAPGAEPTRLRFKLAQNGSLPALQLRESAVAIDHTSLAGHVAITGEPLVIADVYDLPDGSGFQQNRGFDERHGYRTKSMLVLPMATHRDEIVGVLQLINRTRSTGTTLSSPEIAEREVIAFDEHTVELVSALAAHAAVAIENNQLYSSIERLFEGFVTAAVTAIEQRDPATSGHSVRVATLTVGLAEAAERHGAGPYSGLRFSVAQLREMRYASLLHDFGKVGVRESVLGKAKKLHPLNLEVIRHRFAFLVQAAELEFERARASFLETHGRTGYAEAVRTLEARLRATRLDLERHARAIENASEPSVTAEGDFTAIMELADRTFLDIDGEERPLLDPHEFRQLSIRKGTLDDDERRELESHVTHTWQFLQQIPWTAELRGVPGIAYAHHEKLNGSGYPRGIEAPAIPVQTRIMSIADIFDALTATDRPYKRAISTERAIALLEREARDGDLDAHLVQTFIAARVWTLTDDAAAIARA